MDFGKILDTWDKTTGQVYHKDTDTVKRTAENESSAFRRRRLLRKSPDGTIDLHGLTRDEAWDALALFFDSAKNRGLEKILIIHGKGNHAGESADGVLKKMVRDFVERCPFAGESGYSNAQGGGSGSTWVLLKGITVPGR